MRKRQIEIAIKIQKIAFEAFKKIPVDTLSPKDIKEFIKLGTEIERANISATNSEDKDTSEAMTIDIYLPEKDGDRNK